MENKMIRRLALLALLFLPTACGPSQPEQSASPPAASAPSVDAKTLELVAALPAPYKKADYTTGRRVFGLCQSCHTIGAGENNRVGPNLHGLFGRKTGAVQGFSYSPALMDAGFTWDAQHLDRWVEKPEALVPGTTMLFDGVADPDQRQALVAYLMVETARAAASTP